MLFIYNNSRISQSRIRNQETYLWFWSKLASNQVQGLHLNKGGEGDSLVQGDLGVLSVLEKYRVTIQQRIGKVTYISRLEREITRAISSRQETDARTAQPSRGAALVSTISPVTVFIDDLKQVRGQN